MNDVIFGLSSHAIIMGTCVLIMFGICISFLDEIKE